MARLFTVTIFEGLIAGNDEVFESSSEHYDLLGRADEVIFQFFVTNSAGAPKLSAEYLHSNDGQHWKTKVTLINEDTITYPVYENFKESSMSTGISCAQGKITLSLSLGTSPSAYVKVVACGRTH